MSHFQKPLKSAALPSGSASQPANLQKATKVLVDNRATMVKQRKLQAVAAAKPVVQRQILKDKKTKKVTKKYRPIVNLASSAFYTSLKSDDERAWAQVLHTEKTTANEDKVYTQQEALNEIQDRISKGLKPPVTNAQADPAMRPLIEKYDASNSGRRQDRQIQGLHGLYTQGTPQEKTQLAAFLQDGTNAKDFTEAVRQGQLNETLLTSHTKDAALRSLGTVPNVLPYAETKKGDKVFWTDYQSDTSYPTNYFVFKATTTDENGNEMQDTHINGSTYRLDSKGVKHLTVGDTSYSYHFSAKDSLENNFDNSTSIVSLHHRNIKMHRRFLARRDDILAVSADDRGEQYYQLANGQVLNLNDDYDLERYAEHVDIHTSKVETALHRQKKRLRATGNESESEASDYDGPEIGMDADTDDEAEVRIKKRKKKKQKTKP